MLTERQFKSRYCEAAEDIGLQTDADEIHREYEEYLAMVDLFGENAQISYRKGEDGRLHTDFVFMNCSV